MKDLETNLLTKEQIEDLLNYIGVIKIGEWKENKIQFCCPIHKEEHPSCGINSEYQKDFHSPVTQVFNCFSCHESGRLDWFLYKSMPDKFKSVSRASKFIEDRYKVNLNSKTRLHKKQTLNYYEDFIDLSDDQKKAIPITRLAPLMSGKETYKYYFSRGFNKADMREYKVGRDLKNKTVTFPVFYENGELAGIIGRYIDPKRRHNERYKIYDHFNRGELLYPIDKVEVKDDTLIIVESIIDVQIMRKWGIKNVLAIMGSSLTVPQAQYLKKHCSRIIDLLDNDEGGEKGRAIAKKRLGKNIMYLTVKYPDKKYGKDPSEWGEELTKKTIETASLFTSKIRRL